MGTIDWIRPSGSPITTNDSEATVDHCVSQGWVLASEVPEDFNDGFDVPDVEDAEDGFDNPDVEDSDPEDIFPNE